MTNLGLDDCIAKITSKFFRLYPVLIRKKFEFNKKKIISSEK